MACPVVGQELALEPAHVDAHRTFGLAGPAFQAEVERLVDTVVAEPRFAELSGHGKPEDVCPPAGRVRFFLRGHVGRTHGAAGGLPADAQSAAHLDGAAHTTVVGEVEARHRDLGLVPRAEPQAGRHRRRVDDLTGVEDAVRVERAFDGSERLVELRPEHFFHERAAHEAVAVLAGQRAAVLEHEVGDFAGNGLEGLHACLGLHVDDGPDVQAAHRRVGVDAGLDLVPPDDPEKPLDVVAQPVGRDRRIFDERQRLGVVLHGHRQAERDLANAPHPGLCIGRQHVVVAIAEPVVTQVLLERVQARGEVLGPIRVELHAQDRPGVSLDEAAPGWRGARRSASCGRG